MITDMTGALTPTLPRTLGDYYKRDVRGNIVVRDPSAVIGVTLHQTATTYGLTKKQLRDAEAELALNRQDYLDPVAVRRHALHLRARHIHAHAMAFRDPSVGAVIMNPLLWFVQHGNGQNKETIGLEHEGNYHGVEGNPRTLWSGRPETSKSDALIETARELLTRIVEDARALGCPIEFVFAHCQSHGGKPGDPGEWLWKEVAVEHGQKKLGLRADPDRVWDYVRQGRAIPQLRGKPIPTAWRG